VANLEISSEGDAVEASSRFAGGIGAALEKSILKGALLLGRKVAEHVEAFKKTVGTRRLSRSFLVPEADGTGSFMLGAESPVYAAIQNYGGTIVPIHGEYLHWKDGEGEHFAKEVHIKAKHYADEAIAEFEASDDMQSILAFELTAARVT
jgi:hypothetical protein